MVSAVKYVCGSKIFRFKFWSVFEETHTFIFPGISIIDKVSLATFAFNNVIRWPVIMGCF